MAIVKLRLRSNSQGGFDVLLRTNTQDIDGTLPPLPSELETSYIQWQFGYRQIDEVRSCIAPQPGVRLTPNSIEIHSNQAYAEAVRKHLNESDFSR
ncbi:hypothetical protein [Iningainema tapete]|uniref:Uncharacterized protein n=1 Tax=Iningainema tapete BLCC-T55 TaxID=2748662 RepID=A0A8J7CAM0_9CYAN|nr:hypothetical protein [Iningainema tapete]MBD2777271.1 hypothetical protein [Iningainema tapete BLCC-T55]